MYFNYFSVTNYFSYFFLKNSVIRKIQGNFVGLIFLLGAFLRARKKNLIHKFKLLFLSCTLYLYMFISKIYKKQNLDLNFQHLISIAPSLAYVVLFTRSNAIFADTKFGGRSFSLLTRINVMGKL